MGRSKSIIILLLVVLLVTSLCFNVHHCTTKQGKVCADITRTTHVDTIPYYKPIPKDSVEIRYINVKVPIVEEQPNYTPDTIVGTKTDSIEVELAITQKVYEDSSYTAYVSGYMPQLDSLQLRMQREVITIKELQKPKRWGVGVHIGYGMNANGDIHLAPYIGVGITYNLVQF